MKVRRGFILLSLLLALPLGTLLVWRSLPASTPSPPSRTLAELMGGVPPEGFLRALPPAEIRLPRDHGAHPGFQTEWWYFTGQLAAPKESTSNSRTADRHFGFQLTFFRSALVAPQPPDPEDTTGAPPNAWATDHLFMGHFALSVLPGEGETGRFYPFERFARGARNLAGVEGPEEAPFRVWLGPWSAASLTRDRAEDKAEDGNTIWPLRLQAHGMEDGEVVAIDLQVDPPAKPVVLQGDAGYSRKGANPGDASYYYTYPRLATVGWVTLGEQRWRVEGESWLDREWSTSALGEGQVGWDWFALQLTDGREIMLYQLRREDGTASPFSKGTLVAADGTAHSLEPGAFTIQVQERWRAPDDGALYPARWRLRIETGSEPLELEVQPLLADQELHAAVRYWEGAVEVLDPQRDTPLGRGYVELTGYTTAGSRGGDRAVH